jgi:hypothetical protein
MMGAGQRGWKGQGGQDCIGSTEMMSGEEMRVDKVEAEDESRRWQRGDDKEVDERRRRERRHDHTESTQKKGGE